MCCMRYYILALPSVDRSLTIIATLIIVPYVCSPCGHGACGPCSMFLLPSTILILVMTWLETSDTCPECRTRLSPAEPVLRDFMLERILEKYAKATLSPSQIQEREKQVTYLPIHLVSSPPY